MCIRDSAHAAQSVSILRTLRACRFWGSSEHSPWLFSFLDVLSILCRGLVSCPDRDAAVRRCIRASTLFTDVRTQRSADIAWPRLPTSFRREAPRTCVVSRDWLFFLTGSKTCEVRVKIGTKDLTTTYTSFSYYGNTEAKQCLAYGPGLLPEGSIACPTMFIIQARNGLGENRTSGNDTFLVQIHHHPRDHPGVSGEQQTRDLSVPSSASPLAQKHPERLRREDPPTGRAGEIVVNFFPTQPEESDR